MIDPKDVMLNLEIFLKKARGKNAQTANTRT
jgi:hypothetical protein